MANAGLGSDPVVPAQSTRYRPYTEDSVDIRLNRDLDILEDLLKLERRCFGNYYAPHKFNASQFRYYLQNDRTVSVVARRNGRIGGYALGIALRRSKRHIARIYGVAVDPGWRRQHIAARLVDQFVVAVRRMGCSIVLAEVAVRNRPALRLFEKAGFKRYRKLPEHYGPAIDGVRLRLVVRSTQERRHVRATDWDR